MTEEGQALLLTTAGVSHTDLWRRDGLHRLSSRRISVEHSAGAVRTVDRVAAENSGLSVMLESTWSLEDGELGLRVEIEPSSGWPTVWPRIGIRFELPDGTTAVDGAEWFGLGPHECYPDSLRAAQLGRFSSTVDGLRAASTRGTG